MQTPILHYLQSVMEIMKHLWARDLAKLLLDANKLKKHCLDLGRNSLEENELNAIFNHLRSEP